MARLSQSFWNELTDLSAQDNDIIKRFQQESSGVLFMNVADILRKRGFLDEAIVIMEDGIGKFQTYHGARASLGRDYYLKGMMKESLEQIEIVLRKSPDNPMAQRLRLKLALIFNDRATVMERLRVMEMYPDDDFTLSVRNYLTTNDWMGARGLVLTELQKLGIKIDSFLSTEPTHQEIPKKPLVSDAKIQLPEPVPRPRWELPVENHLSERLPTEFDRMEDLYPAEALSSDTSPVFRHGTTLASLRGDTERYLALKGFRRIAPSSCLNASAHDDERRGMDGATLADIYLTQGMHGKAIELLERLVRDRPSNPEFRIKLANARNSVQTKNLETNSPPTNNPKRQKLHLLQGLLEKLSKLETARELQKRDGL